jgi:hypothetical protein
MCTTFLLLTIKKTYCRYCILCSKTVLNRDLILMPQQTKPKEVLNNLSEQGYSKAAAKAIKQWYGPTKKFKE